jgi:hypothetical protein
MQKIIVTGFLALLATGFYMQHGGMDHSAMAQNPQTQAMLLAAQDGHMMMPADKGAAASGGGMCAADGSGKSGCAMGGGMEGMKGDKKSMKGGMKGDMKGMMGEKGMMSGCCCANMGMQKPAPKNPA